MVLAVAGILANAAYQAGSERELRAGISADARAVLAIGVEYQAEACDADATLATVPAMVSALDAVGVQVIEPVDSRRWRARFAGTRPAVTGPAAPGSASNTRGAAPMRESGVRVRAELTNASALERGVLRSMGGWSEGSTAVVAAARPALGDMRVRRARLARGRTAAERAGGC